ncbi:hypothetical protein DY000_02052002 [Brassica cretica]|uniref:3-hydroxyisobutyryl-CoA hydrolase n=1 Tax=Brassica cretica TaxID=69181 RepID=A0ABQ7A7L6_BRACR|nr:hypothetical protein DY000_02052002 [Brassica cretica]
MHREVHLETDSINLVKALTTGPPAIEIYGIVEDITCLSAAFDSISFSWIPHNRNRDADALAKQALHNESLVMSPLNIGLKGDSSVNDIGFVRRLAERACKLEMAQEAQDIDEQVVVGEQKGSVRWATLDRTRQLNVVISSEVVLKHAEDLETWEKDDNAKLIVINGFGRRSFPANELKMFYDDQYSGLKNVYRMYWLCYHIHTYKKTQDFATPEANFGFHIECGFSYIHSRLPGHLGEFLALTGAILNGKELVAIGMATHFVPRAKVVALMARLARLDSGDTDVVRSTIEEFSEKVDLDKDSILNKQSIIDACFSKESVKQIIQAFEAEGSKEGNEWITRILKRLKESSPTALKINLRSIREARNQTLGDCLKKEFRITGVRALTIAKDNCPRWNPATLDEVDDEKIKLVFKPLEDDLELRIPETEENSVKQIIQAFEAEGSKEGNEWITRILKRLKESSPTALKINLRSIREARNQTLGDCLKKEFRITGVRALTIAKDNCPRWNPATLDEVDDEKIKLVFKPLEDDLELRIPETEENRWEGKAETSGFASVRG